MVTGRIFSVTSKKLKHPPLFILKLRILSLPEAPIFCFSDYNILHNTIWTFQLSYEGYLYRHLHNTPHGVL